MQTPRYLIESTIGMPDNNCFSLVTSMWPLSVGVRRPLMTMPHLIGLSTCPENLVNKVIASCAYERVQTRFFPSMIEHRSSAYM